MLTPIEPMFTRQEIETSKTELKSIGRYQEGIFYRGGGSEGDKKWMLYHVALDELVDNGEAEKIVGSFAAVKYKIL